jgi:hypothetical protein
LPRRFTGLWLHGDFRRLWAAQTISIFGTLAAGGALRYAALLWLDAGAGQLAILAACDLVPPFLAGPFAGAWVDRVRKRPLMILADLVRFGALATVPLAAVLDVLTFVHLVAAAVATSTVTVFFNVAYEAYVPALVGREQVVAANAKVSASASIAEITGFGISGWLVVGLTAPGAVLVDAASYLVSAMFLRRIRAQEPPPPPAHEREQLLREAVEGARVTWRHPVLRTLAGVNALASMGTGIIGVTWLLYLVDELDFSPGVLGMIFGIGGATSLIGAYVAGRPGVSGRVGPLLAGASWVRAAGTLFMPLTWARNGAGYGLLVGNQIVTDPAWTFTDVHETSLRQAMTEDALLGRVSATSRVAGFGAGLAGIGLAALIGETWGAREALFTGSGLLFLAAAYVTVSPVARIRRVPLAMPDAGSGTLEP